jgi:hypothetical protein
MAMAGLYLLVISSFSKLSNMQVEHIDTGARRRLSKIAHSETAVATAYGHELN